MVDEGFAALLGSGEERLRDYSIQFLKEAGYDKPLLYDPACSTGQFLSTLSNNYTMACPPVRGDNPRALASGLSYVLVDKHGITILYHLYQCRPCTS